MTLSDYISPPTLQKLQDAFSEVAEFPVRLCDGEGRPLTEPSAPTAEADEPPAALSAATPPREADVSARPEAPILVQGEAVGRIYYCCDRADEAEGADEVGESGKSGKSPCRAAGPSRHAMTVLRLMAGVLGRLCDREKNLRARIDELATLYHLTAEFAGQRDLQSVLNLVTETVVQVVSAKACAIRLLSEDGRELVIKAVANLSREYLTKGAILLEENPVDQEVLATGRPVYVPDQRTDPRVTFPEESAREGLVSGLCVPVMYHGHAEGVLRVYMGERHEFDWFEISLLQAITAQAAAAIVNARLREEALAAGEIRRQLRLAGVVQRRMIPTAPPRIEGFDIGAVYVPCFELGGDFYDFIDLPPANLGVAVCDVAGKGVRASLLMASVRASLRAHAVNVYDMSVVLGNVNRTLCSDTLSSDFATMFYGVLDVADRRFTYANAGHPPPLLVRDGEVCHLGTGGCVLGIDKDLTWGHDSFTLTPGDVILLYTDGLSEAINFADEAFGAGRIEAALLDAVHQDMLAGSIVRHVLWHMRRFAGLQRRLDDTTLVAIKAV